MCHKDYRNRPRVFHPPRWGARACVEAVATGALPCTSPAEVAAADVANRAARAVARHLGTHERSGLVGEFVSCKDPTWTCSAGGGQGNWHVRKGECLGKTAHNTATLEQHEAGLECLLRIDVCAVDRRNQCDMFCMKDAVQQRARTPNGATDKAQR